MAQTPNSRPHPAYISTLALVFALVCAAAFAVNHTIDPLWFYEGNTITHRNFGFDERKSKLNQFLRNPANYDCLIFGSSRATWMPASALQPHRCFNLAFSAGQPEEFILFAEYLRDLGFQPSYVFVGVDGFIFQNGDRDPLSVPEYVKSKTLPPSPIVSYLSIDTLSMSLRVIRDLMNSPGYYDQNFEKTISARAPVFRPKESLAGEGLVRTDAEQRRSAGFSPANAVLYGRLVEVFPQARAIGYVPPISAWHIAELDSSGQLNEYLDALYEAAQYFERFVDFSIPSAITARTDTTYDGSHYSPAVNRELARVLMSEAPAHWGVDVKPNDRRAYGDVYRASLSHFSHLTDIDRD